ncbi:MAG: arginine--tRNA ligase, partial [Candidatus Latescibacteria bacterium]|nr:arginine--tRNA ligase [Candidatus Latescibacterota bacterium]
MKEQIVAAIADALHRLGLDTDGIPIVVERPREAAHGDLSTPVAMSLGKRLKQNPLAIAERVAAAIQLPGDVLAGVEAVRPGFVNMRLALPVLQRTVSSVLAEGDRYGTSREGEGKRVQVEYVSANPTGPLVIVSARAASVGNCLLNLLDACGYGTQGEYYVNDAGKQIEALGESLRFRAKERLGVAAAGETIEQYQYPGGYLATIASDVDEKTARSWLDSGATGATLGRYASQRLLDSIRGDMTAFGARFDRYFLESSLHPEGLRATFDRLVANGHTYEQDGAVFFRSTAFGDDKDRVIRKADGDPTYFLADIAYHA